MSEKFNKNDAKKPSDFKKRRFNRNKHKPPIGEGYTPSGSKEALDTPVENLGLRPQTLEILLKGGIRRCFDIAIRTEREMFKIQNLGRKHCNEIEGKIKSLGLCLRPDERNNKPLKDFNKVAQEQKNPQQNKSHEQPKNHEKDSGGLRNGGLGQRVKPKFIPDEPPKKEPETFIKFSIIYNNKIRSDLDNFPRYLSNIFISLVIITINIFIYNFSYFKIFHKYLLSNNKFHYLLKILYIQ